MGKGSEDTENEANFGLNAEASGRRKYVDIAENIRKGLYRSKALSMVSKSFKLAA
jgi:hypothetical protein